MKKMRWFCVLMAMLCLMVMVPDNAFAYEDATNRITIYSQFGLKNGKTNNGSASSYLYTEDPYLLHGGNRICESDSWVAGKSWNGKKDCLAQMYDVKEGFILPIHHDCGSFVVNGSGYDERKNLRHNRYFYCERSCTHEQRP